jgi:uncharacterized protein (DUF1778 family)
MSDTSTPARKTTSFILRIAPEDKAVLEKAATSEGVSLSSYFRESAMEKAARKRMQAAA